MTTRPAIGLLRACGPAVGLARFARVPVLALCITFSVAGCTTQQTYNSAQSWQRNECHRQVDTIERERCIAGTTMTYDDYRRRRDRPQQATGTGE